MPNIYIYIYILAARPGQASILYIYIYIYIYGANPYIEDYDFLLKNKSAILYLGFAQKKLSLWSQPLYRN